MAVLIPPGIYDLTNEEYHACEGISRSALNEFRKSPYHYWYYYIKEAEKPPTRQQEFGTAFHTYILEPHLFEKDFFYIKEKVDARTNKGKEILEEATKNNPGKKLLRYEEYLKLFAICESLHMNEDAVNLIKNAQFEKSIFWTDPDTGILCKCRPDILKCLAVNGETFFIAGDLKTSSNAHKRAFKYSIRDYSYDLQVAMTNEGIKHVFNKEMRCFAFIVTETKQPYPAVVYPTEPQSIEIACQEFKKLLFKFKECQETDTWPCYENEDISLI